MATKTAKLGPRCLNAELIRNRTSGLDIGLAMTIHACDLCGSGNAIEVPHCREYTGGQVIYICSNCGFVYVRERRSPQEIADTWSNSLFGGTFSARMPYMKARHVFVADTLDVELGLREREDLRHRRG